jgi:glutathione S-transferase
MKLFYSPLACSMATRIALEELGRSAEYIPIDHTTRRAPDGSEIHPLGMVPVLHTDDGRVLTENSAILQYVAAGTDLVPHDPWPRAELQRWLSFIGTELHKAVFIPLLDKKAPDGAKAYALDNAAPRLAIVDKELAGRTYLLDRYSHIGAFMTRVKARPVVARCLALELEGYLAERGSAAKRPPSTRAVIDRFNDVFQRHDTSALDALVADSCVIENTDGHAYRGKSACIALWGQIADDPQVGFVLEEVETAGDRALVSWTLRKDGVPAARGVNLMRVKDGRIVHARGYAKPA